MCYILDVLTAAASGDRPNVIHDGDDGSGAVGCVGGGRTAAKRRRHCVGSTAVAVELQLYEPGLQE